MEKPPKKPGGDGIVGEGGVFKDKVSGGEYVVEGPPKKPGGICCVRAPNDKTVSGEYLCAGASTEKGRGVADIFAVAQWFNKMC